MAELDSTAQSGKKLRIRSPSPVLKIRITSLRSGLTSWARSAAWKLARSSRPIRAIARADWAPASAKAAPSSSGRSMTRTPGSRAIRGPWPRDRSAEQHGDPLAIVGGEFLDDPVGQRVVPADDQVVPVLGESAGYRGHGEI